MFDAKAEIVHTEIHPDGVGATHANLEFAITRIFVPSLIK
jgi:hypothetical protein